jgi:hypothetical protein
MAESYSSSTSQPDTAPQGRLVDRIKDGAATQLTNQKNRGIDAIGSVTQAFRSTTDKLRDDQHDTIARYVENAADQIEGWTERLREKDIDELLGDVQRLARRQPAIFVGSAFALGAIGARFLKSSGSRNAYDERSESRRARYGGEAPMSAAADRTGSEFDRSQVNPLGSSPTSATSADVDTESPSVTKESTPRSTRTRRSSSRTEGA